MFTEGGNALRNYLTAVSRPVAQGPTMLRPAITISRETGAGALPIANLIARQLDVDFPGDPPCSWIVFDRNLITKVLEDHDLSKQIEEFMPEDARFPPTEAFEFLLGLHPPSGMLREYAKETIRKLATAGNVILVGRGGAMITAGLRHVLRVRLVAPFEFRVRNYVAVNRVSRQKAMRTVRGNDAANRQYIRSYFGTNISDPRHYDLIINTEANGFERAARVICRALQELMADQSGKSEPETAQAGCGNQVADPGRS